MAHMDEKPPLVVSLADPDGRKITDPGQVAARFRQFYNNLYKSQCTYTQREIHSYLASIQFPQLHQEQGEQLLLSMKLQRR